MVIGDKVVIGIFVFFVLLGALGALKWFVQVFTGAFVGLLVLICVAILANNPKFNLLTKGIFRQGVVIPYIEKQVSRIEDFRNHKSDETCPGKIKASSVEQRDNIALGTLSGYVLTRE